jgi:membrane-associated phospholipid phosphatase
MPGLGLKGSARTLAVLNLALADAGIAAWDAKYAYDCWRPVTAIRRADEDGNAATAADAAWSSLITTPHPEYVSGHSTFSAAAAAVLTDLFGEVPFATTSEILPGVSRSFDGFWDAALGAGRSRIYGGIHFEYANAAGRRLGEDVAERALDAVAD